EDRDDGIVGNYG
ncbi:MAG: hypothetical protein EZS28_050624, partial [Streblomastix strix]